MQPGDSACCVCSESLAKQRSFQLRISTECLHGGSTTARALYNRLAPGAWITQIQACPARKAAHHPLHPIATARPDRTPGSERASAATIVLAVMRRRSPLQCMTSATQCVRGAQEAHKSWSSLLLATTVHDAVGLASRCGPDACKHRTCDVRKFGSFWQRKPCGTPRRQDISATKRYSMPN